MAKKMTPGDASKEKGVAAADLKRVVKEINRHKEQASENAGLAGQTTKNAIEQYALDRKALGLIVGLSKKEPAQQQSTLRGIVDYADKLGMFDSIDMFDDLIPSLERIIARAKDGEGKKSKADPAMAGLLDGAATAH
ncbi:hypothetical protein ACI6PO_06455 [Agrobacterium tumefaciens]